MKYEDKKAIIEEIFHKNSEPDAVFSSLLPTLGDVLQCDRVFLYLRSPHTGIGKIAYCWLRSSEFPDVTNSEWHKEPESLASEDPMWAAAIHTKPSIFVEDVYTASPEVLNKDFEEKNFGHRALIHAHLCANSSLWGVLQPCIFNHPRVWTEEDRNIINFVIEKITPLAVAYVKGAKI